MDRSSATDAELVRAVGERDRGALNELYRRHEPWVRLRLARRTTNRDAVELAVQDTFVTVWKIPDRYRNEGAVGAWIWGIAVHELLHHLRPRRSLLERLSTRRHEQQVSAEEQVLRGVEHGALGPALAGLSPELRAVVQATVLDGLTTTEAGALLGIPAGTVKTRMMRARAELRTALAAAENPLRLRPLKEAP
jgi:RNA polymerase sigma-70 factor (ECF subfamily)